MMAAAVSAAAAIAVLLAGNSNRGRLESQALVKHWTRFRIVRLSSDGAGRIATRGACGAGLSPRQRRRSLFGRRVHTGGMGRLEAGATMRQL
jgi:hypothetical protein